MLRRQRPARQSIGESIPGTTQSGRNACRSVGVDNDFTALSSTFSPQRRQVSQVFNMAASTSRPLEYLEGLPGTTFFKLYQQPSTALAIFRRMLPDLGIWSYHFVRRHRTNVANSKMLCDGFTVPEGSSPDGGLGGLGEVGEQEVRAHRSWICLT